MVKKGDSTENADQVGEEELLQLASQRPLVSTGNPQDAGNKKKDKKKKRKRDHDGDTQPLTFSGNGTERERADKRRSSKEKREGESSKKRRKSQQIEESSTVASVNGGTENCSEHKKRTVHVGTGLKAKAGDLRGKVHSPGDGDASDEAVERKKTERGKKKTKSGTMAQSKVEAPRQLAENNVADSTNYGAEGRLDDAERGKKEKKSKKKKKEKTKSKAEVGGSVDDDGKTDGVAVEAKENGTHVIAADKSNRGAKKRPFDEEGERIEKKKRKEKKEKKKKVSLEAVGTSKHTDGGELVDDRKGASAAATAENSVEVNVNGIHSIGDSRSDGKLTHTTKDDKGSSESDNESSSQIIRSPGDELSGKEGADRPTTEEIFKRASKKRKVFLHGYAAIPFPSREHVYALGDAERHKFIKTSASFCGRLVQIMHKLIVSANQWMKVERKDDFTAIEEALTSDMARLKKLPLARQYVEMTLWRRILQLNQDHLQAASKIGFGKGLVHSGGLHQGLVLHLRDDPDAEFVSYREAHMSNLVERFHESLEKMRNIEKMDSGQAHFLLRCLDAGSNLFGNLKCLDKKQHERANNLLTLNDNSKGKWTGIE